MLKLYRKLFPPTCTHLFIHLKGAKTEHFRSTVRQKKMTLLECQDWATGKVREIQSEGTDVVITNFQITYGK